ncbi:MAG: hypothetical protein JRH03_09845 [Deltaproteobacteria bacterium]|nr:hypothetical protein [Deltaproteobacteria bacterium]
MKLHKQDSHRIMPEMESLAHANNYEKILAKIPSGHEAYYKDHGYIREAVIPEYFNNGEHAVFMAKYFSSSRKQVNNQEQIREVLSLALRRKHARGTGNCESSFSTQICRLGDINEMIRVFRAVFETYPFPIFDADFLSEAMQKREARYYCARKGTRIVAIAASEIDWANQSVEMTDFEEGMRTAFSIARAISPAMSLVFAANGYSFGGTLDNNTNIAGHIQSMNIWHKRLQPV